MTDIVWEAANCSFFDKSVPVITPHSLQCFAFLLPESRKPASAQQKSQQEMKSLPADYRLENRSWAGRNSECAGNATSDMLAANPSRLLVAAAGGKRPACHKASRLLAPAGILSELCQHRCCSRSGQGRVHSRQLHSHLHNRRMGSTAVRNSHSRGKQHKHSPSKEQGASWESFPRNSGRDRINDTQPTEQSPLMVPFCS